MYKSTPKNQNSKSEGKPIYANGRVIGKVYGDCFYKSIAKNHYLQKPPAIAFSCESLGAAERAGAVRVCITDRDSGTKYRATIQHIKERGFSVCRSGFEPQIALPLDGGWTVETKGQPVQKSLFAGM